MQQTLCPAAAATLDLRRQLIAAGCDKQQVQLLERDGCVVWEQTEGAGRRLHLSAAGVGLRVGRPGDRVRVRSRRELAVDTGTGEGTYRFQVSLGEGPEAAADCPLCTLRRAAALLAKEAVCPPEQALRTLLLALDLHLDLCVVHLGTNPEGGPPQLRVFLPPDGRPPTEYEWARRGRMRNLGAYCERCGHEGGGGGNRTRPGPLAATAAAVVVGQGLDPYRRDTEATRLAHRTAIRQWVPPMVLQCLFQGFSGGATSGRPALCEGLLSRSYLYEESVRNLRFRDSSGATFEEAEFLLALCTPWSILVHCRLKSCSPADGGASPAEELLEVAMEMAQTGRLVFADTRGPLTVPALARGFVALLIRAFHPDTWLPDHLASVALLLAAHVLVVRHVGRLLLPGGAEERPAPALLPLPPAAITPPYALSDTQPWRAKSAAEGSAARWRVADLWNSGTLTAKDNVHRERLLAASRHLASPSTSAPAAFHKHVTFLGGGGHEGEEGETERVVIATSVASVGVPSGGGVAPGRTRTLEAHQELVIRVPRSPGRPVRATYLCRVRSCATRGDANKEACVRCTLGEAVHAMERAGAGAFTAAEAAVALVVGLGLNGSFSRWTDVTGARGQHGEPIRVTTTRGCGAPPLAPPCVAVVAEDKSRFCGACHESGLAAASPHLFDAGAMAKLEQPVPLLGSAGGSFEPRIGPTATAFRAGARLWLPALTRIRLLDMYPHLDADLRRTMGSLEVCLRLLEGMYLFEEALSSRRVEVYTFGSAPAALETLELRVSFGPPHRSIHLSGAALFSEADSETPLRAHATLRLGAAGRVVPMRLQEAAGGGGSPFSQATLVANALALLCSEEADADTEGGTGGRRADTIMARAVLFSAAVGAARDYGRLFDRGEESRGESVAQ